jgi:hypothetical protein
VSGFQVSSSTETSTLLSIGQPCGYYDVVLGSTLPELDVTEEGMLGALQYWDSVNCFDVQCTPRSQLEGAQCALLADGVCHVVGFTLPAVADGSGSAYCSRDGTFSNPRLELPGGTLNFVLPALASAVCLEFSSVQWHRIALDALQTINCTSGNGYVVRFLSVFALFSQQTCSFPDTAFPLMHLRLPSAASCPLAFPTLFWLGSLLAILASFRLSVSPVSPLCARFGQGSTSARSLFS